MDTQFDYLCGQINSVYNGLTSVRLLTCCGDHTVCLFTVCGCVCVSLCLPDKKGMKVCVDKSHQENQILE
jgi:hypothetical protein